MPRKNEPYSSTNPVPKAATNLKSLINPKHGTEAKAEELQDQSNETDAKKTEETAQKLQKGKRMRVRDPTTGDEVEIRNADEDDEDEDRKGRNVLDIELPPPDWSEHKEYMLAITTQSILAIVGTFVVSVIVLQLIPLPFIPINSALRIPFTLAVPSVVTYCLLYRFRRIAQRDFENRAWNSERIRGLTAGSDLDGDGKVNTEERTKESAEWANEFLRGLWPIINPQMFQSMVDLLEDIMQSSVPKFIHSVRIADLHQGRIPLRITSIRSLRDASTDEAMEHLEGKERDQLKGDHLNLEIAFAYRSAPSGRSKQSKAQNAHLLIEFFVGMKGVWASRVPVWVEVKGAVGTARIRLQLIPDPPFVKTTLISLMGLPRVDIQVTPMAQALPDVMNIPILSEFISNSLDAAAATYVAPKSLTLDLQQLISGDDIKKDTTGIGILVVHIHRATGIKKMDTTGSSADPYVTLTYSRLGKPIFSTRIIKNDLNPVFEETALLVVHLDNVKLKEQLSIQLWDSDRTSADDMLGFVEMDIADCIKNKNNSVRKLSAFESPDGRKRHGSVEFTIGYYAKTWPNSALKTDGSDPGIPKELREKPEFKEARATALNDLEAAVLVTSPDPEYPTGILSVQIHEITDLSVRTEGKETVGGREGEKGQDDSGENQEDGEGLPSSYCTISINDELVYETRVKPLSSSPMFNAGTERVIKDWRQGHVTVVIKDSRVRENDAILGVVFMKLSEIFVNASEVTRSYPVEKGGRIRISLLFRPIEVKLPRKLLGFNIGTIHLRKVTILDSKVDLDGCDIEAFMSKPAGGKLKISHKEFTKEENGSLSWKPSNEIRLPVRERYSSALIIRFKPSGLTGGTKALATLWLRDIIDKEQTNIEVVIWDAKGDGYNRLIQNYVPSDGDLDGWNSNREDAKRIGTAVLDLIFIPGVSDVHQKLLTATDGNKKTVWEEFVREDAQGLREQVGDHSRGPEGTHVESDKQEPTSLVPPEKTCEIDEAEEQDEEDSDDGSSDEKKGLKGKWHEWREEEKALHRDHRGIMQRKPARTAKWIKDSVEVAGHKVKERFSQQERQPDVETEV